MSFLHILLSGCEFSPTRIGLSVSAFSLREGVKPFGSHSPMRPTVDTVLNKNKRKPVDDVSLIFALAEIWSSSSECREEINVCYLVGVWQIVRHFAFDIFEYSYVFLFVQFNEFMWMCRISDLNTCDIVFSGKAASKSDHIVYTQFECSFESSLEMWISFIEVFWKIQLMSVLVKHTSVLNN